MNRLKLIGLGSDHYMQWYVAYANPDDKIGIIVWHPLSSACERACIDHGMCGGAVNFDVPGNQETNRPKWTVIQWDPLTLSPSLLCHCGDHGWIRDGKWAIA